MYISLVLQRLLGCFLMLRFSAYGKNLCKGGIALPVIPLYIAVAGGATAEFLYQQAKYMFMEKVQPIEGSIVCCSLCGVLDHSGVYVGDGKIVHRDGDGCLEVVSPKTFLARQIGRNPAWRIYVSCYGKDAVGFEGVAERALEAESDLDHSEYSGYHLRKKNCHNFSQYCLTGIKSEDQGSVHCNFTSLEKTLKDEYGFDTWRLWDLN